MARQERFSWFAAFHRSKGRRKRAQRAELTHNPHTRRLRVEPLEDRRMLTVTVDTLAASLTEISRCVTPLPTRLPEKQLTSQ